MDDRPYATDNGFYVGDKVEVGHGLTRRETYIEEILDRRVRAYLPGITCNASLVRLRDGTKTLDIWLTRIG